METRKKLDILGIPIDMVDMNEAGEILKKFLSQDECKLIVTPNSEILERATRNKRLASIIKSANLVIPDGIGLVYASRFLGKPLKERVTGIDFLNEAFDILSEKQMSVFLLGGKPADEELISVADEAAKNIKKKYPNLKIAGTRHGYFKADDEEEIVEMINTSQANFLCVALGSPKQEEFMAKYKEKLLVKAAIGVGGSLDVWSERVKRAPTFFQNNGLEWLYRVVKEPTRLARLLSIPIFIMKVIAWRFRGKN